MKENWKKGLIGLFAGLISGFFASGGGMILVPAFVYFLKVDQKKARATSGLVILPMTVIAGVFYFQNHQVDWAIGIKCAAGGMVGGLVGAKLLKKLSPKVLRIIFIVFLIYAAIKMVKA